MKINHLAKVDNRPLGEKISAIAKGSSTSDQSPTDSTPSFATETWYPTENHVAIHNQLGTRICTLNTSYEISGQRPLRAKLIAAAPALYEAAKWMYSLFDEEGCFHETYQDQLDTALKKTRAALSLVEGSK